MRELIGKECRAVFNLPHNEWPIEGYPAWVIVDAVDMPMVKMRSRFSGSPLWVNAATLKTIQVVKETAVDPLWVRLLRRWSGDSQPMKKFQGSSLYLTPEGLRDQTGEIILTKREILDELVGPGAEAPLPEGREQECPLVVRTALRVLLNHIEPGHWENCRVLVQSWLDGKLDALMQQQLPQEGSGNK